MTYACWRLQQQDKRPTLRPNISRKLLNRASRAEVGSQAQMMGHHYLEISERDQMINQLKSELATAQSRKQSLAGAENASKHLADELRIAKMQMASVESAADKVVRDIKVDHELREEHLQRQMELDAQSISSQDFQTSGTDLLHQRPWL